MAYTPNPTDVSQPVDSVFASTAAAEFRALKAYLATVVAGGGPGAQTPGMIASFAFAAAPPGWLIADGSLVSRTTYSALWALATTDAISEASWSGGNNGRFSVGDGSTTFRLPDFRGVLLRGLDGGRGLDSGRTLGSYQADTLGGHYHRTTFGFDGSFYYAWRDGSDLPVYGSDLEAAAARFAFATSGPGTNGRFARTSSAVPNSTGETVGKNSSVIVCIKT